MPCPRPDPDYPPRHPSRSITARLKAGRPLALTALGALAALPLLAQAHPGVDAGQHHTGLHATLLDGLAHPFTGLDHLAAMLAVGLWSAAPAHRRGLPAWAAPVLFTSLLGLGALLAASGLWPSAGFAGLAGLSALTALESLIAASVLVLGLMLASERCLPAVLSSALVAGFGLLHGAAHGLELGQGAALIGMVAASAALHATGLALGTLAVRLPGRWARALPRLAGAATAALGGALLLA